MIESTAEAGIQGYTAEDLRVLEEMQRRPEHEAIDPQTEGRIRARRGFLAGSLAAAMALGPLGRLAEAGNLDALSEEERRQLDEARKEYDRVVSEAFGFGERVPPEDRGNRIRYLKSLYGGPDAWQDFASSDGFTNVTKRDNSGNITQRGRRDRLAEKCCLGQYQRQYLVTNRLNCQHPGELLRDGITRVVVAKPVRDLVSGKQVPADEWSHIVMCKTFIVPTNPYGITRSFQYPKESQKTMVEKYIAEDYREELVMR